MIKIIYEKTVYIPVEEIIRSGILSPEQLQDAEAVEIPLCGKALSELTLNRLLMGTAEEVKADYTRVDTLSSRVSDIQAVKPLKFLFLSTLEKNEEKIAKQIEEEAKRETEKAVTELCNKDKPLLETYKKTKERAEHFVKEYSGYLKDIGLTMQFITRIGNTAGLTCFLAGDGIFYEIYLPEWEDEDILRIKKENGSVTISEPEETDERELVKTADRDFRKYTAMENIWWCLSNLDVNNDFSDEINCDKGGIYFCADISMIIRFINPVAFPKIAYINGIAEITEETILPVQTG